MMTEYKTVLELVRSGVKTADIVIASAYNFHTTKKHVALARIELGLTKWRVEKDKFTEDYLSGVPVEVMASEAGVSKQYIKDIAIVLGLRRDPGLVFRSGHKSVWNDGLNKGNDERFRQMSVARTGPGNPNFGMPAWNKGLSKETDQRVAALAKARLGLKVSKETRAKQSRAKTGLTGAQTNRWKGGHKQGGYVIDGEGNSYCHRRMAERLLGRKLRRSEHVHHMDRERTNNHISNLIVIGQVGHGRLHGAMNRDPELDQIAWLVNNKVAFEILI